MREDTVRFKLALFSIPRGAIQSGRWHKTVIPVDHPDKKKLLKASRSVFKVSSQS
jgi:hypothetical protein